MSRFEIVPNGLWAEAPFCDVSPVGKLVYFWTWTSPACRMAGIYRVRVAQIVVDTGLAAEEVAAALVELETHGMVRFEDGLLWVCARVQRLRGRNPGVARSIAGDIKALAPEHPFRVAFLARYATDPWLRSELGPLVARTVPEHDSAEGHPTFTRGSADGVETVCDFPVGTANSGTVSGPSRDGRLHLSLDSTSGLSSSSRLTTNAGGRARTREAEEDEVWAHYIDTVYTRSGGPVPTFDETRRAVVRDALAVRDVRQCKLAISGLSLSDHHNGFNEHGVAYTDIRYALRGNTERGESHEDRIDRWAALAAGRGQS